MRGFCRMNSGSLSVLCCHGMSDRLVVVARESKTGRVLKASCGCCTAEPAERICPSGFPRQVPAGGDWPQWEDAGVFVEMWHAFLDTLDERGLVDWEQVFHDGSFAPAKKRGADVGKTKRGKGTKWMVVADGQGIPLACWRLERVAS
jgi:hypothetical protein